MVEPVAAPVVDEGRCGSLEWAAYATAHAGQTRSGDAFVVQATEAGVLVAVVDGLGHGDEAAEVSERALATVRRTAGQRLPDVLTASHAALRGSRGVVMTLARIDHGGQRLDWLAVGNVDACVVRRGRAGEMVSRSSVPLRAGVVGDRLPPLREASVGFTPGDVLVVATDGLSPAFLDAVTPQLSPRDLASRLHRHFARADDDALVLVARCGAGAAGVTARPTR